MNNRAIPNRKKEKNRNQDEVIPNSPRPEPEEVEAAPEIDVEPFESGNGMVEEEHLNDYSNHESNFEGEDTSVRIEIPT